ncbi:variant erythrocyte surface antigen beta subunit, putative [Babesia ovis]|uniref:Variant erythrocyte surface antigen beta subunit, putative n=1 Tax=Babesia ovis TaxID=5869 RepID=A0A9W5TEM7_BABOV|nr:variant erythrocyte surface antigen beta subunit, putative [Babesia ovis]
MGYLLWSMTVNLDLMHIQSHWRSPRSYLVPLQRILADGSRKGFCTLGYFQEGTDVEGYLDKEELGVVRGTLSDLQGVEGTRRITGLVVGVSSGLGLFVGWKEDDETSNGIGQIEQDKGIANETYKSAYGSSSGQGEGGVDTTGENYRYNWDQIYDSCTGSSGTKDAVSGTSGTEVLAVLARILLGAIPLVFSGLSYLYYTFGDPVLDDQKGKPNGSDTRVGQYMQRMGYEVTELVELRLGTLKEVNGKQQMTSEGNVFSEVFKECQVFGDKVTVTGSYAIMLDELRKKAQDESKTKDNDPGRSKFEGNGDIDTSGLTSDQLPLLKLNILCSGYFRSLHTIDSIRSNKPRLPRTVREILYWLTSLPYCPIYRTLVPKVQEMIRRIGSKKADGKGDEIEVKFYGSDIYNSGKTLDVSTSNCVGYLLGAALVAPLVILCIQDTLECLVGKDEKAKKKKTG